MFRKVPLLLEINHFSFGGLVINHIVQGIYGTRHIVLIGCHREDALPAFPSTDQSKVSPAAVKEIVVKRLCDRFSVVNKIGIRRHAERLDPPVCLILDLTV